MDIAILDQLQRRFGSADFGRYQVVRGQKYDFVRVNPAGSNQLSFFSNPIGATDPNAVSVGPKTLEQTNLVKSASFGQEYFAITQIRLWAGFLPKARQTDAALLGNNYIFQGLTSRDPAAGANAVEALNNFIHRGVLQVSFAQKLYYQIQQPLLTAPAGFGVDIQSLGSSKPTAAVNKKNYFARVDVRGTSVYNVDPIQIVEPEIQIEVKLDFPDANYPAFTDTGRRSDGTTAQTPAVEVGLIFDGYVIRPSQ